MFGSPGSFLLLAKYALTILHNACTCVA